MALPLALFSKKWLEALIGSGHSWSVGDVRQSFLTEAQFQSLNGTDWVLCDGRSVTGSQYDTITGNANIPDARGRFLRGKDNGAGVDADGELSLGALRNSKTANANIPFTTTSAGAHQHPMDRATAGLNNGSTGTGSGSQGTNLGISAGAHSHSMAGGDNETVPKHCIVNHFVKIN